MNNTVRKVAISLKYFLILVAAIVVSSAKISYSSYIANDYSSKVEFFNPVIKELLKRGVDSNFIYFLIADSRTNFNEKYVKINVTGYLKKVDYSKNYDRQSVEKSKEFMSLNKTILDRCEIETGVPKEIITAVLWVETKHGNFLGDNHIVSVFLSTAMAGENHFINMNKKNLRELYEGDSSELKNLDQKIAIRAKKKAGWAIGELLAIEKIDKTKAFDILGLTGSWAGAFGLSQFLPSSYLKWAVDGNHDRKINLFDIDDAIYSVANYLIKNGWGKSRDEQRNALFKYNNSNDYVDAVIILASKLMECNWKRPIIHQFR